MIRLIPLAVAIGMAALAVEARAHSGPVFKPVRYEDPPPDMRDREPSPWSTLKAIPLDADGDATLTLSGELRLRWEDQTAPGSDAADGGSVFLRRAFLFADAKVGAVRLFGELFHADAQGRPGGASPVDRNELEF